MEIDNFIWGLKAYFTAMGIMEKSQKVNNASRFIKDIALVWWRYKCDDIKRRSNPIETWDGFKRKLKKQFYPKAIKYGLRPSLDTFTTKIAAFGNLRRNPQRDKARTPRMVVMVKKIWTILPRGIDRLEIRAMGRSEPSKKISCFLCSSPIMFLNVRNEASLSLLSWRKRGKKRKRRLPKMLLSAIQIKVGKQLNTTQQHYRMEETLMGVKQLRSQAYEDPKAMRTLPNWERGECHVSSF